MLSAADHFRQTKYQQQVRFAERRKWFRAAKEQRQRNETLDNNAEDTFMDIAAAVIIADQVEIDVFKQELDIYDEATLKAILENREILESLYTERDRLLDNAYQLDDGRRVFKSEDGVTVIDEFGHDVPPEVVMPEAISDIYSKAEEYLPIQQGIIKHEAIEKRLYNYQEHLDDARELANSGKMTQQELDDYRQQLQTEMPIEVRKQLPDDFKPQTVPLKNEFNIPADDVPTIGAEYNRLPDFSSS